MVPAFAKSGSIGRPFPYTWGGCVKEKGVFAKAWDRLVLGTSCTNKRCAFRFLGFGFSIFKDIFCLHFTLFINLGSCQGLSVMGCWLPPSLSFFLRSFIHNDEKGIDITRTEYKRLLRFESMTNPESRALEWMINEYALHQCCKGRTSEQFQREAPRDRSSGGNPWHGTANPLQRTAAWQGIQNKGLR